MNMSINVSLLHAGKCLNSFRSEWKKKNHHFQRLSFDSDDKNADLKVKSIQNPKYAHNK